MTKDNVMFRVGLFSDFSLDIKKYRVHKTTDSSIWFYSKSGVVRQERRFTSTQAWFYAFEEAKSFLVFRKQEVLRKYEQKFAIAEDKLHLALELTSGDVENHIYREGDESL